jgi:C4-dicarboxylate-specific signal transduction histidine kinase
VVTWSASGREANSKAERLIEMEREMESPAWEMSEYAALAAADRNSVITAMTPRRQHKAALKERLRFETFLADLSATFVSAPANALHNPIQEGLQQLVAFFALDNSTLVEVSADQSTLHLMYSSVKPGLPSSVSMATTEHVWDTEMLLHGEAVCFSWPAELPAGSRAEPASWLGPGCHSGLTVPLIMDGEVRYAIIFSAFHAKHHWPDELIRRLRLVGDIFANAIGRQHSVAAAQQVEQELIHVTRVAMLGEFAATLAHELSRPLAAILRNVQAAHRFLTMTSPQLEDVQEALDDVLVDTRRAADLLQRLRALAKKTALQWSAFDTHAMIREVVHLVSGEARMRQVSIILQLEDDLPDMYGDRIQLQQVILNLLLNALEAIAEAGGGPREIVMRTRCEASDEITISVEDSGIGLATEVLPCIFDPFFSTKADGMGMGLTISCSIIMAHHGRIWATFDPGCGVMVSFSMPIDCKEMV